MQIVLLHGLGRDHRIMQTIEDYLKNHCECTTYNISYPSLEFDFPELVSALRVQLLSLLQTDQETHFVCHSMGGILARLLLKTWKPVRLGRMVQIGSPNQGTELVDFLNQFPFFKMMYGVAATRLGTGENSIIHELSKPDYPIGVIGSNQVSWFDMPFDKWVFTRENDGIVALNAMQFEGMSDFIIVPATHVSAISDPLTLKQTLHFLNHGAFLASENGKVIH